jgi:hypothetical protein
MARQMTAVERAARDAMKPYVQAGHMTQGEANKTIRDGLAIVEQTVRQYYTPDQVFAYAGRTAKAREEFEAAEGFMSRHMKRGRLMACEMYAAVYAVVRAEHGDEDIPMDQAVEVMATVRETARELREEAEASRPTVRAIAV